MHDYKCCLKFSDIHNLHITILFIQKLITGINLIIEITANYIASLFNIISHLVA